MVFHASGSVTRARWLEAAHRAEERGKHELVGSNEDQNQMSHHCASLRRSRSARASSERFPTYPATVRHWATIRSRLMSARGLRTMTTRSIPGFQRSRVARKASRTSRLARFRATAVPIFREATTPNRGAALCSSGAYRSSTKSGVVMRRPHSWADWNSARFRTRSVFGKRPLGLAPATTSCMRSRRAASAPSLGGS